MNRKNGTLETLGKLANKGYISEKEFKTLNLIRMNCNRDIFNPNYKLDDIENLLEEFAIFVLKWVD